MRKAFLICIAVLALIPVAAFARGPGGQIVIGFTVPGLQFPFFVTMKNDADAAAAKLGVKLVFVDARNDSATQAGAVEGFVAQKVDAILISPMTVDSLVPFIEGAVKAGVPVATIDRKANTDKVLVHVGADNVEGGRAAARYIVGKLGGTGSVIELEGTPGASPAIDRKKGFDEVIAQNPGIKILVSQTAQFSRADGNKVMEDLMQTNPDFDAVFGANDEMIIGAIEAMSSAGIDPKTKVTAGFDATPDAFAYMQDGRLGATVDQFPGQQAAQAIQYLVDFVKSKKRPPKSVVFIAPKAVTTAP